jgi:hypothetical protein
MQATVFSRRFVAILFGLAGIAHLIPGVAGLIFPIWFFNAIPPWPPLHVGQIQIAGIFDLAMAVMYFVGAANPTRYAPLVVASGIVAECGHGAVRIGHIVAGDNSVSDLWLPSLMLGYGAILAALGVRHVRASR